MNNIATRIRESALDLYVHAAPTVDISRRDISNKQVMPTSRSTVDTHSLWGFVCVYMFINMVMHERTHSFTISIHFNLSLIKRNGCAIQAHNVMRSVEYSRFDYNKS